MPRTKTYYLILNVARALLWLSIFGVAYVLYNRYTQVDYLYWLRPVFERQGLMVLIFAFSELVIGLIPPEVFMIWAMRFDGMASYLGWVSVLAVISYASGIIAFFIGEYLNKSIYFRFIKRRFFKRLDAQFRTFGIYLIIIAAMTPLPYSGVCMLVGATRFSLRRFLLFSCSRFFRFYAYALLFWQITPAV